ncbi:MAG: DUF1836 domain-containing protein [Lachnospiraceae bacterium]|nr:DUF1836 domain-containing protein [Lachnospiraceae bacterium]
MKNENTEQTDIKKEILELLKTLQGIDYVTPDAIPNIDLYMDQVTTFMNEHLKSSKRHRDDKLLTKTMINNYTKNNLLPPPIKKKYSKEHMLLLIFIYYLKNFLSINDIQKIIEPLTEKFYKNDDSEISLAEIYNRVVPVEEKNTKPQVKDIINKLKVSTEAFEDIKNPEDKELLTDFMFICTLSFDIYLKKTLIESIIDNKLSKYGLEEEVEKPKKEKKEKKDTK